MNKAERKAVLHGINNLMFLVQAVGNEKDRDRLMVLIRLMVDHVNYKQCISCKNANSGICSVCYDYDKYEEEKRGDE